MIDSIVNVKTLVLKKDLKYNGETLLTYKINYPEFRSMFYRLSIVMINRYYRAKALEYQKYCETELFASAVEQYKYSIANGYPVRAFEVLMEYNTTYNSACILSLYFDKYEYTGGAHGNTIRSSQTWSLQKREQLELSDLFVLMPEYKAYIFAQVRAQIKKDPSIYFDDYEKLLVETFNDESFYCTPVGVVVYYQQYDIAPYSSGIREFLIPYSYYVQNPVIKCFRVR